LISDARVRRGWHSKTITISIMSIISCISNDSLEKEAKTLDLLSAGSVDGLIISSVASKEEFVAHAEQLTDFVENQIPMVMFDRVSDLLACDKVIVDDFEAAYKATKHLIEIGCENIVVITPINHTEIGELRVEGYKMALKEKEIAFDDKLILPVNEGDDLDFLLSFVLNYKKIGGILALDEITTVKTTTIVKERGYQVPNDISIIGFTNGQLSRYVSPSLTMVSQHGTYIGETCANLLIDRLENNDDPLPFETKVVKTSLVVRESTKSL